MLLVTASFARSHNTQHNMEEYTKKRHRIDIVKRIKDKSFFTNKITRITITIITHNTIHTSLHCDVNILLLL